MEFFDKLGQKASEAYKVTADKTGKLAKEAKLRMKIAELKTQVNDIYKEIGKKVYEKHIREEELDIQKHLEEECTKIDVISDEIEMDLKECLELKDRKQCQSCYKEISKDMRFCPECGAKQEEEPAKEVEILEKLEKKVDIKPENQKEKEIVEENLEQKTEEADREEQNVGIGEKQEVKESESKSEEKSEETETKSELEKTVEVEINPQIKGDNQRISFEKE